MSQKEKIIHLLQINGVMTQLGLSEGMYGDKKHGSNIHGVLKDLVSKQIVNRTGSNPAFYSLSDVDIDLSKYIVKTAKTKKKYRDVSNDVISNETLIDASEMIKQTENYGPENDLLTNCLKKYNTNTDVETVPMKIGLIDITNSTNIARYKRLISVVELAKIITAIPDIDNIIKDGDPEVVNIIAKSNGNINLFSFASKYCCYHNVNLYGNDHYSIFDTVLKEYLPLYFQKDITESQIEKWRKEFDYKAYNDFITERLDDLKIDVPFRKRKLDHYIWFKNRLGAEE